MVTEANQLLACIANVAYWCLQILWSIVVKLIITREI